jgi:glycosyltransferase involved in cell wall biosynthesis
MSASLPVIASATGGTPEIMGSENGALFEYRNVKQLTSSIEQMLSDKAVMIEKGKRSRAIIEERFTVEKMADNYLSIIGKIVNVPSLGRP